MQLLGGSDRPRVMVHLQLLLVVRVATRASQHATATRAHDEQPSVDNAHDVLNVGEANKPRVVAIDDAPIASSSSTVASGWSHNAWSSAEYVTSFGATPSARISR